MLWYFGFSGLDTGKKWTQVNCSTSPGADWLLLALLIILPVHCTLYANLLFKGRILPSNPSQLWQIARPIKEKPFGVPQTSRPHVATRPPLSPWDLTSAGLGVTALCRFSLTWSGRKTQTVQTNRTIFSVYERACPPKRPPPWRSRRQRPTSSPTVEGSCQWGGLPLLLLLRSSCWWFCVMFWWWGGGGGWTHRETAEPMAWILLLMWWYYGPIISESFWTAQIVFSWGQSWEMEVRR